MRKVREKQEEAGLKPYTRKLCVCVETFKQDRKLKSSPPSPNVLEMEGWGGGVVLSCDELSGLRLAVSNPDLIHRSPALLRAPLL